MDAKKVMDKVVDNYDDLLAQIDDLVESLSLVESFLAKPIDMRNEEDTYNFCGSKNQYRAVLSLAIDALVEHGKHANSVLTEYYQAESKGVGA
ncbi:MULTISPECIES: hypothetical protein [unclassified Streptococcus]|uniref:hypothetical protein n=1 Tax=unclassified Streptococcus TaxID=2608887 RepID=UPI0010716388|nr:MULTISPECIES: hypothetical protein [unclassified Streptococcus]MBF0806460.1 hypothetical protein [Streptococcus sp. 19428wA2_WM07]TFU27898.1 hypothetical protein E4T71_06665 [Streptococcus sp. WM07]